MATERPLRRFGPYSPELGSNSEPFLPKELLRYKLVSFLCPSTCVPPLPAKTVCRIVHFRGLVLPVLLLSFLSVCHTHIGPLSSRQVPRSDVPSREDPGVHYYNGVPPL